MEEEQVFEAAHEALWGRRACVGVSWVRWLLVQEIQIWCRIQSKPFFEPDFVRIA